MKIALTVLTIFALLVCPMEIYGQSDDNELSVSYKSKDLSGLWDGDEHFSRSDDWGQVRLRATQEGYIGTYSGTYNGQLGSITFQFVGQQKYRGLWWETDLRRFGMLLLEVSANGQTIYVTWKALDKTMAPRGGRSIWKRVVE